MLIVSDITSAKHCLMSSNGDFSVIRQPSGKTFKKIGLSPLYLVHKTE